MKSLPRFLNPVKPQNLMASVLIVLIVVLLNIAALYAASQTNGYKASNVPQAMHREGRSILINLPGRVEVMVV